jgi:hypothetical protein
MRQSEPQLKSRSKLKYFARLSFYFAPQLVCVAETTPIPSQISVLPNLPFSSSTLLMIGYSDKAINADVLTAH